jgi:Ice-binding-like/Bacterial Ig-like domain
LKSISNLSRVGAAFMLLSLGACGSSTSGGSNPQAAPTVNSTTPAGGATSVLAASTVSASFSEAMDPASISSSTFKLTSGTAMVPVAGSVAYTGSTAVFTHDAPLAADTTYTATITTGGKNMAGMALATRHTWSFSTGSVVVPPLAPTVVSNIPLDGAGNVMANGVVSVTFSEPMDQATLTNTTFTLTSGTPAVAVAGSVTCASSKAEFMPAAHLSADTTYTATVSVGAMSMLGTAIAASHSWSFTTGSMMPSGNPVNLGMAGGFVILAETKISTVPASVITGNLGISPAAASYITGFSLTADSTNVFSTSPQVTGKVYASDYAVPTPSNLTTAIGDMGLAFTDAAGRAPDVTELGAGNIGGMTLPAGVYKWGTGLLIPTDVTLSGSATDVWIFQIAQDLTLSSAVKIHLAGGALPKNIFWQVAGLVDLGTTSHLEGVLLTQTAVTLRTGASVNGRLLAQSAVSIDGSTVVEPAP